MKNCTKCRHRKKLTSFAIKSGNKRSSWCKYCHSKYSKKHYKKNRASYIAKAKRQHKKQVIENRQMLLELKSKPCLDCEIEYPPWVMEFDHVGEKCFNPSQNLRATKKALLKELEKCEVVCANCHADRTYQRRTSRRGGMADTAALEAAAQA